MKINKTIENGIVNGLKERLGETVEIKVIPVGALTPEKSGKYRYVICRVESL